MSENVAVMIYYINSIVSLCMTYYGFVCIFKPTVKKRWILLAYAAFLIISSQQFFRFDSAWANLLVNTAAFTAIALLFSGNLSTRLVFSLLMYVMSVVADMISFTITSYIYFTRLGTELPVIYVHSVVRAVTNIIYLPLLLICLLIFRRLFSEKAKYNLVQFRYTAAAFVMIIGIILLDGLFFTVSANEPQVKIGLIIASQFVVLIVIFLIVWLYNTMLDHLEALEESRLKDLTAERWELQYKMAINSQKAIAGLSHNLRYHFLTLVSHLETGKVADAKKHLENHLGEINRFIDTGNISIDTMLNYYQQQIKDVLNIDLETDLSIPPNMNLNADMIAAILGNALENALEACEKVEPSLRSIRVKAAVTEEDSKNLIITIRNTYTVAPVAGKNGILITTKKDKYNHGLGLGSIQEMLPEKIGHIHYEYENNLFKFMLLIYDIRENTPNMINNRPKMLNTR